MLKFEEHNGLIFKMLDKPVPLTDDTELPVLVMMIQDDTMLGKANKRICRPNTLAQKIICSNLTDGGLFLGGNYAYRYEIIGYPVEEGSAEWRNKQLQDGKPVHKEGDSEFYQVDGQNRIIGRIKESGEFNSTWNATTFMRDESDGWRIYEPKPEPLLADAKIGWRVLFSNNESRTIKDIVTHKNLPKRYVMNEAIVQQLVGGSSAVTAAFNEDGTAYTHFCGATPEFDIHATYAYDPKATDPKPEPIFTTGDKVTDGVIEGTIIHIEDAIADVCPSTDEYKIELRNLNHIPESPKQDDVEKPKPLLAEAKVGDLCQRRDGKWMQIDEIDAEFSSLPPAYRCGAGWWTENGASVHNQTLDIVHTEPLAPEGSKDWAWQMMLLGKIIIHSEYSHENATWKMNNGTARSCLAGMSACSKEQWVANAIGNGWQIYEKPKEEPPKEPDYVICKRCGGSKSIPVLSNTAPKYTTCPKCGGTGYEIKEPCDAPNPESATQTPLPVSDATQYKVGDWVNCKDPVGVPTQCKVLEIRKHNVILECKTGHIWSLPHNNITHKLSPSEIIVNIGCMSGTIAKSSDPNYFLMLHSRPVTDCNHSMIRFSAIDTQTRELVESLLEAQMKGDIK